MADLIQDVNFLRYFHTAQAAVRDKDALKNECHATYSNRVSTLMSLPLFFQFWQLGLTGNEAQIGLYRKVRLFKTATFIGAVALGSYEMHRL